VIGHKRDWEKAERFCRTLDGFIETILDNCDSETTVVMTSDHGNFEDFATGSHTKNPAVLCVFGPGCPALRDVSALDQISPALLRLLDLHR
jgi:2,3-bisphosphoglycerate-independent phosphoglycerate mutase